MPVAQELRNASELGRLIEEQRADDARHRLKNRGPVVRECDLGDGRGGRADLRDVDAGAGRRPRPNKFRGRARRTAIRADDGQWHDTTATGSRASFWVLLLGCTPWESSVQEAVDRGLCECPACKDLVIADDQVDRTGHLCLYCNRSGLDGRVEFLGYQPDSVLNPVAEVYELEKARERRKAKERSQGRAVKVRGGLGR